MIGLSPVAAAVLAAFSPGNATLLRSCATRDWVTPQAQGERITLKFDLPDDDARIRGVMLSGQADHIANELPLGGTDHRLLDCIVWVNADWVLTIDALAVRA